MRKETKINKMKLVIEELENNCTEKGSKCYDLMKEKKCRSWICRLSKYSFVNKLPSVLVSLDLFL